MANTPGKSGEDTPVADRELEQHQPYAYKDRNQAPSRLRVHQGVLLGLDQINALVADAYAHQYEQAGSLVPDWGNAWARFTAAHRVQDDLWVATKERDQ